MLGLLTWWKNRKNKALSVRAPKAGLPRNYQAEHIGNDASARPWEQYDLAEVEAQSAWHTSENTQAATQTPMPNTSQDTLQMPPDVPLHAHSGLLRADYGAAQNVSDEANPNQLGWAKTHQRGSKPSDDD